MKCPQLASRNRFTHSDDDRSQLVTRSIRNILNSYTTLLSKIEFKKYCSDFFQFLFQLTIKLIFSHWDYVNTIQIWCNSCKYSPKVKVRKSWINNIIQREKLLLPLSLIIVYTVTKYRLISFYVARENCCIFLNFRYYFQQQMYLNFFAYISNEHLNIFSATFSKYLKHFLLCF